MHTKEARMLKYFTGILIVIICHFQLLISSSLAANFQVEITNPDPEEKTCYSTESLSEGTSINIRFTAVNSMGQGISGNYCVTVGSDECGTNELTDGSLQSTGETSITVSVQKILDIQDTTSGDIEIKVIVEEEQYSFNYDFNNNSNDDNDNNNIVKESFHIKIDNTAPSAPSNLTIVEKEEQLSISWDAVEDECKIKKYVIKWYELSESDSSEISNSNNSTANSDTNNQANSANENRSALTAEDNSDPGTNSDNSTDVNSSSNSSNSSIVTNNDDSKNEVCEYNIEDILNSDSSIEIKTQTTQTTLEYDIKNLKNNYQYIITVAAIDKAGNEGCQTSPVKGTPLEVYDFYEYYREYGGQEQGGFCFIATAAYGSPLHPFVGFLRNFRDNFLLSFALGKRFVNIYYKYSPPIAETIRNNKFLKSLTAVLLLPVIGFVFFTLEASILTKMLLLGLFSGWITLLRLRRSKFHIKEYSNESAN